MTYTKCGICEKKLPKWNIVTLSCKHKFHIECIMEYTTKQKQDRQDLTCSCCNEPYMHIPMPQIKNYRSLYQILAPEWIVKCGGKHKNGNSCTYSSYPGYHGLCRLHGTKYLTDAKMKTLTHFYINIPTTVDKLKRFKLYNMSEELLKRGEYERYEDLESEYGIIRVIMFKSYEELSLYYGIKLREETKL